ncbi:vacuolar alkaline phosphatase [Hypoxylon texense]
MFPAKFTFRCGHKGVTSGTVGLWDKLDEAEYADLVDVKTVRAPDPCGWECANACGDEELRLALDVFDGAAVDPAPAPAPAAAADRAAGNNSSSNKRKFAEEEDDEEDDDEPGEPEWPFKTLGLRKITPARSARMGQPDAAYGVPRLGVGWRSEEPQEPREPVDSLFADPDPLAATPDLPPAPAALLMAPSPVASQPVDSLLANPDPLTATPNLPPAPAALLVAPPPVASQPVDSLLADPDPLAATPDLPPAPAALLVAPSPAASQLVVPGEKKAKRAKKDKKENKTSSNRGVNSSSINSSSINSSSINTSSINTNSSVGDLAQRVQTDNRPGVGSVDKEQARRNRRMNRFMEKYVNAKR